MNGKKDLIIYISAMAIFGTIGIFRRYIPLDSGIIAMTRGIIGALLIMLYLAIKKRPFSLKHFNGKAWIIILNGAIMGFNWITLFEAYNYTSVATATLCYYMQPIFLIIVSPFLFKEKLTLKKILCVVTAFIGMIFVSGIFSSSVNASDIKGIIYGIISAILYTIVVCVSKKVTSVDVYEKTSLQLLAAGIAVIPYLLVKGVFADPNLFASCTTLTLVMLAIVCIGHTGITYIMYFGSIERLSMQQVALFAYVDPVVAIILSQIILHEDMGINGVIGAVLILGSSIVSELGNKK